MTDPKYKTFTMILPVFNEEARVKRVIEYYRPFARLIVVDNFSTDRTLEILQHLGVTVVQYKNPGTTQTPDCIRYFFSLSQTDYVLFLACSEFIPVELLERFDSIAKQRSHDVIACVRDSYTCGEQFPLWDKRFHRVETYIERFMNKHGVAIDRVEIHHHFQPLDPERILHLPRDRRYVVIHLRDSDALTLVKKSVEYASVEAQHRAQRGKTISAMGLMLLNVKEMLRLFRLPLSQWNGIALREIWARIVMDSTIYWIGWELKRGRSLDYSRQRSEELWMRLVSQNNQKDPCDE